MSEVLKWLSLTLTILTIGGIFYQLVFHNASTKIDIGNIKKQLDENKLDIMNASINEIKAQLDKYALAEISKQVNTIWEVYVVGALHDRNDLAQHHSPLEITEKGESLIPQDVKDQLNGFCPDDKMKSASWIVISCLGTINITKIASQIELSFPITLGLLAVYYRKYHPQTELT